MIFKPDESQGDLNGFLDAGSHMQGELRFEDTFRVDGKLSGKVVSKGDLVVGERGEVDATVHVGRLYVSGTLSGAARADKRVEITPGGRLLGDIVTPTLVIEEGGFFEGKCSMVRQEQERGASEKKPGQSGTVTRLPVSRDG